MRGLMLGEAAMQYLEQIDQHIPFDCLRKRYIFLDLVEYSQLMETDPSRAEQICWSELLMRCHLAGATAILRSRRWIDGLLSAGAANNLLAFAATLRGLIESAADISDALLPIPRTLARHRGRINEALRGAAKVIFRVEGLEDFLIHYTWARKVKKGEDAPESHKAKSVRDYVQILEKGQVPGVVESYETLCDLTHPGARSVHMWFAAKSDLEFELETGQEAEQIRGFVSEYAEMPLGLLMYAFNLPIVTLRLLNYFEIPYFHTPELEAWNLSGIRVWRDIEKD